MYYQSEYDKNAAEMLSDLLSRARRSCWFGAISFEDRCVASVQWLQRSGLRLDSAVAMNYPTQVLLKTEDKRRREKNRDIFQSAAESVLSEASQGLTIEPYSFQAVQSLVLEAVRDQQIDFAIFDVSCMTRIHVLGLAATLGTTLSELPWAIAYSSPENYGNLDSASKSHGWKDIIVAPIAETAVLLYEAYGRGIILAGHESDRLIVALSEIEPSGGLIVIGDSPWRPDLADLSERVNRRVFQHLTKLRASRWEKVQVSFRDISSLDAAVEREIVEARQKSAPVILLPNGPKSLVFFTALKLVMEYPNGSWFVYPVPAGYDVDYSEGTAGISWFARNSHP